MKKKNQNLLENFEPLLEEIKTIDEMDSFISEVCEEVGNVYTCISCPTGCNTCCTGVGLPIVYAREWKRIRNYLETFPEEKKHEINNSLKSYFKNYGDILFFLHKNIGKPISEQEFKIIFTIVRNEGCPLLINGKCSVYPVRPTACRTFGYFFSVEKDSLLPLTCKSDSSKLKTFFETEKIVHPKLPLEIKVRQQLETFIADNSEKFEKTIIPIWLLNDSGKFTEEDFKEFDKLEDLLFEKGKNYFYKNKFKRAEEVFTMLIEFSKKSEYFYYLGSIKFENRDFKTSMELFSKSLKEGYKSGEMLNMMGLCLKELGDNITADKFFQLSELLQGQQSL